MNPTDDPVTDPSSPAEDDARQALEDASPLGNGTPVPDEPSLPAGDDASPLESADASDAIDPPAPDADVVDPADLPFGLGAIASPTDPNDWPIDALYATLGLEPDATPPPSYIVPSPYPPVLNQGTSPMCVAFSSSTLKAYEDLRDTGAVDLDEPTFFHAIGGTEAGAIVRDAFARMLNVGYPVVTVGNAGLHRIAAYYAVPVDRLAIQAAIQAFGPVLLSTRWPGSWFHPSSSGVLPKPDAVVGGHAIVAIGWDSRGLRLRNSWGTGYGESGDVWMPWAYIAQVREAWKAVDKIDPKPTTASYGFRIAAGTTKIRLARFAGGCISGWSTRLWSGKASSARCKAAVIRRGCVSGQATVAYVTTGAFAGHWIRIGSGVSIFRIS